MDFHRSSDGERVCVQDVTTNEILVLEPNWSLLLREKTSDPTLCGRICELQ